MLNFHLSFGAHRVIDTAGEVGACTDGLCFGCHAPVHDRTNVCDARRQMLECAGRLVGAVGVVAPACRGLAYRINRGAGLELTIGGTI